MKKTCILLLSTLLVFSCNNTSQKSAAEKNSPGNTGFKDEQKSETPEQAKNTQSSTWTSADVKEFFRSCVNKAVSNGADRKLSENYCSCMQEKMEVSFPDTRDMANLDMESSEIVKMIKDCKVETGLVEQAAKRWSRKDQLDFVNNCVDEAEKNGMDYLDAQSYCDCMQEKIEKLYPNPADAALLTEKDFSTAAMKKLMRYCMAEDY